MFVRLSSVCSAYCSLPRVARSPSIEDQARDKQPRDRPGEGNRGWYRARSPTDVSFVDRFLPFLLPPTRSPTASRSAIAVPVAPSTFLSPPRRLAFGKTAANGSSGISRVRDTENSFSPSATLHFVPLFLLSFFFGIFIKIHIGDALLYVASSLSIK